MDDENSQPGPPERRHITVLDCDLVDSTALAHKLDPEKLRDLVLAFQDSVLVEIEKLDGHFAQFAGDAIWAYFGYPTAHEDDAIRAVEAGLNIIDSVSRIHLHDETLNVRVGIASGLCVVGDLRKSTISNSRANNSYITAIGDPPNLAARIQAIGLPGTVTISDETRSLTGRRFIFQDLQYHKLKGFSEEVRVWQALEKNTDPSRYKTLRPHASTPIIGRTVELHAINELWNQARKKRGQVVYLTGDPGIGKSRLVMSIAENVIQSESDIWWVHCNEHLQQSPFAPIITLLQSIASIKEGDNSRTLSNKLRNSFPKIDLNGISVLSELLGDESKIVTNDNSSLSSKRREELDDTLLKVFKLACNASNLLVIFEDVHWIDPSTRNLLDKLVNIAVDLSSMLIITKRNENEYHDSHSQAVHVNYFHLEQLNEADSSALVKSVYGEKELPDTVVDEIVKRTDGVPLFIEDLTFSYMSNYVIASSSGTNKEFNIPANLSEHLMWRLDNLAENKLLAQVASVMGNYFTLEILSVLTGMNTAEVSDRVNHIVETRIFSTDNNEEQKGFKFTHSLMRESAYNSLLFAKRIELHHRIALWQELDNPSIRRLRPELIAYHFQHAEQYEKSVKYWLQAGKRAKRRSNFPEAIAHLEKAYQLLTNIKPSLAVDRIKLDIRTTQAASEAGANGISSIGCGVAYDEARALCQKLNYPDDIFPVLSGAGSYYFLRAKYHEVRKIANELLELAEAKSSSTGAIIGNRLLGAVEFVSGNFELAVTLLESAIQIYDEDPLLHQSRYIVYSMDQKTSALCYLALAYLSKGEEETALSVAESSVEHSRTLDKHSQNYALCYLAGLRYFRGDSSEIVYRLSNESLEMSLSEGFPSWTGMSRLVKGAMIMQMGDIDYGFTEIKKGVKEHSDVMAQSFLPFAQTVLATAYSVIHDTSKAFGLYTKAEVLSEKTGQYWYLPEILRLHGDTLALQGQRKEASSTYLSAVNLATQINSGFWLSRIKQSQSAYL